MAKVQQHGGTLDTI